MNEETLLREYQILCQDVQKVYVVPLINFSFKKTNYLYLLYKEFIEKKGNYTFDIESLSVFSHPQIFLSRIKKEKSILHYHWLEISDFQSLCGMVWKIFWISLYKFLNGKIIWTIHNKFPHSNKYIYLNRTVRKYMANIADRLQVHCKTAVDTMAALFNVEKSKFFILNHPEFSIEIIEKEKAVEILNKRFFPDKISAGDKLFLMFGEIAGYKGIKEIVKIFNSLEEKKKLIIAGTVKKGNIKYYNRFLSAIKNKNKILIYSERISDEDIPVFLNSCDYALFNFKEVLTSGSVVLALNYNKNVIIPFKGCLKELAGENIIHFDNEEKLRNILINC